MTSNKSLN